MLLENGMPLVGEEHDPLFGKEPIFVNHCLHNWNQILKELRAFPKLYRDSGQS